MRRTKRFRAPSSATSAAPCSAGRETSSPPALSGSEPRAGTRLRPDPVGVNGADDREPVLRLLVADRVPARQDRPGRTHLLAGRAEDRGDGLLRQLLGKLRYREREQRPSTHRKNVVERVRRGDRSEVARVVDGRREEVESEDEERSEE